jgi:hypothetical protein
MEEQAIEMSVGLALDIGQLGYLGQASQLVPHDGAVADPT